MATRVQCPTAAATCPVTLPVTQPVTRSVTWSVISIVEWSTDHLSPTPTRSPTNLCYQEDATQCHKGQKEEMKLPFVLHFCLICHGRGLLSWRPGFNAPQRPRVQSRCQSRSQSRGQSRGQLYPLLNGVLMTCRRRLRAPLPTFATRKM